MVSVLNETDSRPVLFYDGECGLCDRTVQTILDLDTRGALRLSPLQGETAREVLLRHGLDPDPPEGFKTLILVRDLRGPGERLYDESRAVIQIWRSLGGCYPLLGGLLWLVPFFVRDALYRLVSRNRQRFFPPPAACRLPTPETRKRFLP